MTIDEYKDHLANKKKKANKYGNVPVRIDGTYFQSTAEGDYYGKLKLLKKAGLIKDFKMQVRYDFIINSVNIGFYKSDFDITNLDDTIDVCDVKGGPLTAVFQIKRKLLFALYGIKIKIIK